MESTPEDQSQVRGVRRGRPPKEAPQEFEAAPKSEAQILAERIWEGQSVDLPRSWRMQRIKAALAARGYDQAVVLP